MATAWNLAHPNTPLPGSQPGTPMPAGGLEEVTGFDFRPAVFDTFGGCSSETDELLMDYAKQYIYIYIYIHCFPTYFGP